MSQLSSWPCSTSGIGVLCSYGHNRLYSGEILSVRRPLCSSQQTWLPADDETFGLQVCDRRIRLALRFLRESKTPQLSDVAARLNLSTSRFRHLFKQEVGVSPKRFITSLRLRWAKQLFENSCMGVKEVAALIGLNDVSHFVRNYKATYLQTPSQTRELGRHASGRKSTVAISAKK